MCCVRADILAGGRLATPSQNPTFLPGLRLQSFGHRFVSSGTNPPPLEYYSTLFFTINENKVDIMCSEQNVPELYQDHINQSRRFKELRDQTK